MQVAVVIAILRLCAIQQRTGTTGSVRGRMACDVGPFPDRLCASKRSPCGSQGISPVEFQNFELLTISALPHFNNLPKTENMAEEVYDGAIGIDLGRMTSSMD